MHRPEAGAFEQLQRPLTRRAIRRRRLAPTLILACTSYLGPAHAERWTLEPTVTTRATYTDNVAFDEQGTKQGDTIFELIPNLLVRGEGKRFRLVGNIGFDGWVYAGSTRANRV